MPWFEPPLPRLLAHRGFALEAPENTLLAFLKALALGATYLETDVHATRDGVAVISHDPDLSRIAGRSEQLGSLTLRELQQIDLGCGQTFCTLAEALDAFPAARFNIDIKVLDAAAPAAQAILEARATGRVLIGSFSGRRRRAAVRLLPGVATSASTFQVVAALAGAKLGVRPLVRAAARGLDALQVPLRGAGMSIPTKRVIANLHAAGIEIHVWTINDVPTMLELLELGVDGIVTDRIDLALELINDRN
ncbi:MAG TPA: glycerophosphodiester phosphodiesterase family protein [Galbitalea sp.]